MEIDKPSIIIGHNVIAPGCATMEGDHNTHGAPLPPEEILATKEKMNLDPEKFYHLSNDVISNFRESYDYARQEVASWRKNLEDKLNKDDKHGAQFLIVFVILLISLLGVQQISNHQM